MTQESKDQSRHPQGMQARTVRVCIFILCLLTFAALLLGCILRSNWLSERLAEALSSRLGQDLTIGDFSCSPRGKLLIRDVTLNHSSTDGKPNINSSATLEIGRLSISPHWTSIFNPA